MRRLYTRTGDSGMTSIHGRIRVPKTDIRIEANGSLDELNVAIGTARSFMTADDRRQGVLKNIQLDIMGVMSLVATRADMRDSNPNRLPDSLVADVERLIDQTASACSESAYFILPGGTRVAAMLHEARVAARRAERRLWELNDADPVPADILTYVNRLSDLFFVMAREEMECENVDEERWQSFAYKRVKK